MTEYGRYGIAELRFALPDGWQPASREVLATAVDQALAALSGDQAVKDAGRYYDPVGAFSGTLFLDVQPNHVLSVDASDLYAVTTLSMKLHARHGRLLLEEGKVREEVRQCLRTLPHTLAIAELEGGDGGSAETLARMYQLHSLFRGLLAGSSERWVTAAKLCARKRPRLFPVRDNLVCTFLGGGRKLKSGDGWPGDFSVDIQVYAYLLTHPDVLAALRDLRGTLTHAFGLRVDNEGLRLLDAALWMRANRPAKV